MKNIISQFSSAAQGAAVAHGIKPRLFSVPGHTGEEQPTAVVLPKSAASQKAKPTSRAKRRLNL